MNRVVRGRILDFVLIAVTVAAVGVALVSWSRRSVPSGIEGPTPASPDITPTLSTDDDGRPVARFDAALLAEALRTLGLPTPRLSLDAPDAKVGLRLSAALGAVSRDPSAEHYGHLGQIMDYLESWPVAQACYEKAHGLDPADHRWPHYLGRIAVSPRGQPELAERYFRAAIALRPDYPATHGRLADVLIRSGRQDAARAPLERLLQLDPTSVHGHMMMARLALAAGKPGVAKEHLEKALATAPEHGPAHSMLSRIYADRGELSRSAWHARRAGAGPKLLHDPVMGELAAAADASEHDEQLLKQHRRNQDWQGAIATLGRLIERRPRGVGHWLDLAAAYEHNGQPADADRALERALALRPAEAYPRVAAGRIALYRGDPETALEYADLALERDDRSVTVHEFRAKVLEQLERTAEACAHLERALELGPPDPPRLTWCAELLFASGRGAEAIAVAKRALVLAPEDLEANRLLVRLHYAAKRYSEALPYAQTCVHLEPTDVVGLRRLAQLFLHAKRFADAKRTLRDGLRRFPDDADLRADLEALEGSRRQ